MVGARDGQPLLADRQVLDVAAIIWCTGLQPDHRLLHLDGQAVGGDIEHRAGVVTEQPGLYVLGQPYQRTVTSHLLGGVGADAQYIVDHVIRRSTSLLAVASR